MSNQVKRWLPLESNPEVLRTYLEALGVEGSCFETCDVFGLDEELLAMVPQPVVGVVLLYPITEDSEKARLKELDAAGRAPINDEDGIYYMKQTIGNACGTIALLHIVANNRDRLHVSPKSFLGHFLEKTSDMNPVQRGAHLENPPIGQPNIDSIHKIAALEGDSAVPSLEEEINLHFVALVQRGGQLWELDGRRSGPVSHGKSSKDTFLSDCAQMIQQKYVNKSSSITFSVMAISSVEVSRGQEDT